MPQMYDLYNDQAYDALTKRTNSSMRYEQLVLAPSLSCMHDAIAYSESTMDWLMDEKEPPSFEELGKRIYTAHNTFKGVFALLSNQYTMIQLRASMESDATVHGGAEALRAKLAFIEEKAYAGTDKIVTDTVLTKWLKEFDNTKAKAVMNMHAKASAKISTFRDRQGGKGKGGAGSGSGSEGANSEVMEWISRGAKMRWVDKAPQPFDHGVSLADATPQQLEWITAKIERGLRTGARCGALPSGWNDSPRIFVKVMKVLVECLRLPRRAGGCGREEHQQGARVLPYMDDFLVLLGSRVEALRARELASRVLVRLGLERNEKKGHWEPTQLVEHLGLDLKAGQFHVTLARLQRIHLQANALLREASRQRRWLPARKLAVFTGLCQSVSLAVPPARLYLWELHFVITTKRGWGAKEESHKGGVLNLKHAARGFWPDELRHLHITHLELEAVYKTVQSFLRELTGKAVRLYCDNQAVVAMLSHFTSRNSELMRRMRRLWILLDLNDIELHARYIRSEANEWAGRLSRDKELDDWRLNDGGSSGQSRNGTGTRWTGCGRKVRCAATVVAPYWPGQMWFQQLEALADEVVIVPRCRDLFTPSRLGGSELLGASKWDGVMFRISASRGTVGSARVDGLTHVAYDDEDEEHLDMSKEKYEVIPAAAQSMGGWDAALQERWRGELGDSSLLTELAVQMQGAALGSKTVGNYRPKAKAFMDFCDSEGRQWLPAPRRSCSGRDTISVVLHKEKGMGHVRLKRRLTIPADGVQGLVQLLRHWEQGRRAVGTALERCCFLGGWSQLSSAVHSYIDPTAAPDEHMERYLGWTTPRWRQQQPGT
ncbi:hypothetical protein CYMTET_5441 [Cymbomonas tetramitiformis]|uniref:Reverse transcriptase domain-containing protein n=1 Tax=Cymbomonas tetramitiformis TaxID=36881 RepID=A0AAE0H121_9CHLO|nr:hypothetical protein CYMTET_5441 [Cymbomonas tetramitiformis]